MFQKPEYKLIGRLILNEGSADGSCISSTGTDVYACLQCGSLVFDQGKHNLSHTGSRIGLDI